VRIHNFIQEGALVGISMEYVPGGSLPQIRAARGLRTLGLEEMRTLMGQLCDALEYAHTKPKIVHRDLKPANLMLDARGELKIADFGISRSISDSHTRLTSPGDTSGTLAYMSPQQMMGEPPKPGDDLYALGATIFDLLTGKPPFHSGDVVRQALNVTPPTMTARREELGVEGEPIPPEWEWVVAACLSKENADRPSSALAVAEQLGLRIGSGSASANRAATAAAVAGETVVLGTPPTGLRSAPGGTAPAGPAAPTRGTAPTSPHAGPPTGGRGSAAMTSSEGAFAPEVRYEERKRGGLGWPVMAGGAVLVHGVTALAVFRPWERPAAAVSVQPVAPPPVEVPTPPRPETSQEPAAGTTTTPIEAPSVPSPAPVRPAPEPERVRRDDRPVRGGTETGTETGTGTARPADPPPDPPAVQRQPDPAPVEPKPAPVKPPPAESAAAGAEPAIRNVLHRYEQALEALDLGAYAALWVSLPEKSRTALSNSFRDTEAMSVDVSGVHVEVNGTSAVARFKETRTITPKAGPKQTVNRDVRMELSAAGGGWKISKSGS
jgi:hypothetical protein